MRQNDYKAMLRTMSLGAKRDRLRVPAEVQERAGSGTCLRILNIKLSPPEWGPELRIERSPNRDAFIKRHTGRRG